MDFIKAFNVLSEQAPLRINIQITSQAGRPDRLTCRNQTFLFELRLDMKEIINFLNRISFDHKEIINFVTRGSLTLRKS